MQELDLKTQETTALLRNVNQQFGCAMHVRVQLYNGEYADAEQYNYTRYTVLSAVSKLPSGSICTIRELYDCVSWEYHHKERQQLVRNTAMHLAVTREANLKFFTLEDNGDPLFYVT